MPNDPADTGCACRPGQPCSDHASGDAADRPVVDDYRALLQDRSGGWSRWNEDGRGGEAAVGVTFVTYSFREAGALPGPISLERGADSAHALNAAQRATVRDAMAQWDDASGLVLIEVAEGGMIDLFGIRGSDVGGYSDRAGYERDAGGVTVVDLDVYDRADADWQTYVWLHEIGHRLGFAHTHEGAFALRSDLDTTASSVMSYEGSPADGATLGPLDLAAARYLYGADQDEAARGIDYAYDDAAGLFTVTGSSRADVISGVAGDNLIEGRGGADYLLGSSGDDTLRGGAGDDTLSGTDGDDLIEGGAGDDVLYGDASPEDGVA